VIRLNYTVVFIILFHSIKLLYVVVILRVEIYSSLTENQPYICPILNSLLLDWQLQIDKIRDPSSVHYFSLCACRPHHSALISKLVKSQMVQTKTRMFNPKTKTLSIPRLKSKNQKHNSITDWLKKIIRYVIQSCAND